MPPPLRGANDDFGRARREKSGHRLSQGAGVSGSRRRRGARDSKGALAVSTFLRERLSALRGQFSTAALILSVVAIVAALAGGAIAANGAHSSKTKVVKGPP